MTFQQQMESLGQTTIFDYLEITPMSNRNKSFVEGDTVFIRYYADELDYITEYRPQWLMKGVIIDKRLDFYRVQFDDESFVDVPGEKLKLA